MSEDIPMKKCTGLCGQEYPATTEYWHRDKYRKDGLTSKCRKCRTNEANSDKSKAYRKKYYHDHKEKSNAYNTHYNKEHKKRDKPQ